MKDESSEQDKGNIDIDVDQWLFVIMAMTRDNKSKEALIQRMCKDTGLPLEKVEKVITALLQILSESSRTNLN